MGNRLVLQKNVICTCTRVRRSGCLPVLPVSVRVHVRVPVVCARLREGRYVIILYDSCGNGFKIGPLLFPFVIIIGYYSLLNCSGCLSNK